MRNQIRKVSALLALLGAGPLIAQTVTPAPAKPEEGESVIVELVRTSQAKASA